MYRSSQCLVKFLLILVLVGIVRAAPLLENEVSSAALIARFFKKARNSVKKATKKVSKGVKKTATDSGDGIKNTATKAGDGVKDAANKVGDIVKDGANEVGGAITDAVDTVGDALKVSTGAVKKVTDKIEAALDKACEKAGATEACKVAGQVAQNAVEAANELRKNRMIYFVNRLKSLDEDFKAIADGDVLRAIDVFIDIAPMVFPISSLVQILDFRELSILYEFLKCNTPLVIGLGKDASNVFKQPARMEPLMKTVLQCTQALRVESALFTIATESRGVAAAADKVKKCVVDVRKEAVRRGYKTITIGVTAGGGGGKGLDVEGGVALDIRDTPIRARGYVSTGNSVGFLAGGGGGIAIGFATVPFDELAGAGQGIALGGGNGVVSKGLGLDFINNKQFTRVAFVAEVGLGAPAELTCSGTETVQF